MVSYDTVDIHETSQFVAIQNVTIGNGVVWSLLRPPSSLSNSYDSLSLTCVVLCVLNCGVAHNVWRMSCCGVFHLCMFVVRCCVVWSVSHTVASHAVVCLIYACMLCRDVRLQPCACAFHLVTRWNLPSIQFNPFTPHSHYHSRSNFPQD